MPPKSEHKWISFGFFVCIAVLFILQSFAGYVWRIKSPYSTTENLATLPKNLDVSLYIEAKLLAQKSRDFPDIGVFGNSRSVMLSAEHLDLENRKTFFNFSVGGTSFLQSVRSIEYFADKKLLPKNIIVSFDNRHLQFDGFVYWPNPSTDLFKFLADLNICFSSPEGSLKRCAKTAIYYLYFASKHFAKHWSIEHYQAYFNYLRKNRTQPTSKEHRRLDGSIVQNAGFRDNEKYFEVPDEMSSIAIDYQVLAMESLVQIAKRERKKIFIFESPISPKYQRFLLDFQQDHANILWDKIAQKCDGIFVYCFENEMETEEAWPDCCHAPAQPWADYIVSRLEGEGVFE